jgi:hypothetical protein
MADLQTDMARAVNDFVAQVTEIAKRAALDTLGTALGSAPITKRGSNGAFSRSAHGRGGKRPPEQLEKTATAFHDFVAANPGLRIEQINKQIGLTTAELALPIRKLIASGAIKTKGEKRSTTYFAGSRK